MSISGYFARSRSALRADRRDTSGIPETQRVYAGVEQYDAVLWSNCGLTTPAAKPGTPPEEPGYWQRAAESVLKTPAQRGAEAK